MFLVICIDYRKLNTMTTKDAYAIPEILASRFGGVNTKTVVQVSGIRFFECNRMPFGLCNGPATFRRLMERCMGDLTLKDCLTYLDNIVISSLDIESHIHRLNAVFQSLSENNLKNNLSKCAIFKNKITYVAHTVSNEAIESDHEKTKVVEIWPVPNSVRNS